MSTLASRLQLEHISVERDGRITVWYGDGGLFHGHSVTVYVSADDALGDVNIEG